MKLKKTQYFERYQCSMYHFIYVRNGSIVTNVNIVVALTSEEEAQRDLAKTFFQLLTSVVRVPYNGQNYSVEELTLTSRNGQNTSKEQRVTYLIMIILLIWNKIFEDLTNFFFV